MLSCERVENIFIDCLFDGNADTSNAVWAEGVLSGTAFNPIRLAVHRDDITEMLNELPVEFKDGWSFLQACNDKHGNQWTDYQRRMDQLFQLGIAIGKVECLAPKEMWPALPGGMPYYRVCASPLVGEDQVRENKIELKDENWVWCELCDTVAYKRQCCGQPTCNGGGCDKPDCSPTFNAAMDAIDTGKHPPKESLPVMGKAMEL